MKVLRYFIILCIFTISSINSYSQWNAQAVPNTSMILRIEFVDAFTGYAAHNGIIKTTNGGAAWTSCPGITASSYRGMSVVSENVIFAAAPGGIIRKSTNGGASWTNYQFEIGYLLWGLDAVNANIIYTVGLHPTNYSGKMLKSIDGGATWTELSYTGNGLVDVRFINENLGWAVGEWGRITKTTNGGASFVNQNSNTTSYLWGVYFVNESIGWAVGENGTIRKTTNGGTNWTAQASNTTQALRRVNFSDVNNGYAVGANGTLLKTTNGGTNWLQDTIITNNELWGLCSYGSTEVWTGGANGAMFHKTGITSIPEEPELLLPNDLASNLSLSPEFSWAAVADANFYVFQLASDEAFSNIIFTDTLVNTSLVYPSELNTGTVYYWRVKTLINGVPSPFSQARRFITQMGIVFDNNAIVLNGVSQYIETNINAHPLQMPSTTWEAWVYPTRINHNQRQQIISSDNGWYDRSVLIEANSNKFAVFSGLFIYDWGASSWYVCDVDLNQWQHIAVVFEQNQVHFYKNGKKYTREYVNLDSSANLINIGRNPNGSEYYQGKIDEVRIWSRALNQREIIQNVHCGLSNINEQIGLEAYYKLNENSNQFCIDEKEEYTGILHNLPNHVSGVTCEDIVACELISPLNNALNQSKTPLLSWTSNADALSYRIVIGRDSSFNVIEFDTVITANQIRVPRNTLCCGSEYYWFVASIGEMGSSATEMWKFTIRECSPEISPLITAEWQVYSAPYNTYYPLDSLGVQGSNPCIPTAVSRVVHYWKHPITGRDSSIWQHPTWTAYKDTIRYYQTTYNYSNMPNSLPPSATQTQYQDAALLMWHSNTLLDGGGGFAEVMTGMHKYMKYTNKTKNLRKQFYSSSQWQKILMNELEDGRPILYSGFSATAGDGHAWLVDGYNTQGKFHLQYGYWENDDYYDADSMYMRPAANTCITGMEPENYYHGPILLLPEYNETTGNDVNMTWIARENDVSYRVQISTNRQFNNLIYDQTTIASNFQVIDLTLNTVYYWRVKSYRISDSSAWSEIRKFDCQSSGFSLSGTISYANSASTPMNNCTVIIKDTNNLELARGTTDEGGNYTVTGLANGTYNIEVQTTKIPGGVNVGDILLIRQSIAGLITLTPLQFKAGDINTNGSVNVQDVLPMRQKIAGISPIASWLIAPFVYHPLQVTINGANAVLNIQALSGGDVNGSYVPVE